ncbi:MAG: DUF11 domain-containing protein, partial [Cytophagaceae bacterium]
GMDYTPATITNNSATRNINVQVKNYSGSASIESTFATRGMDRTWQVSSNMAGPATVSLQHNTLTNPNGADSDESGFNNIYGYVSQQTAPGVWSTTCSGTDGGSPVSTNVGAGLILPGSLDATAYFTKRTVTCTDLRVVKTVDNASPIVGNLLVFTIRASNLGVIDATGVGVNDLLLAGYELVTANVDMGSYNSATGVWTIGNLANGAEATLTITARVRASGPYQNTATITGNETDLDLTNNSSTVSPIPGAVQANLRVVKAVNNGSPLVGDNITFTISASNLGPDNASGVNVVDQLAAGYTYISSTATTGTYNSTTGSWAIGNLANGANAALTITARVNGTGPYANTATISGIELDPELGNNTSTVTPAPRALVTDLKIVKTVNNQTPVIGTNVVFTILASNLGTNNATGVNVADVLPAGYTYISSTATTGTYNNTNGSWVIGNLANGANATMTITARVNATGPYANTATITGSENDPDLTNNSSTVTPSPASNLVADLKVVKTVDNANPIFGSNVVFTIVASNLGGSAATGATVTDILPAGYAYVSSTTTTGTYNNTNGIWTIGNLANGASATMTITARVNATGPYANTATITGNENDPDQGNNTSTVSPVPGSAQANLAVLKTVNSAAPMVGSNVVFTIVASNMGPSGVTGVTVTDVLPIGYTYVSSTVSAGTFNSTNGVWTLGSLASGTSATMTITAKVNAVGPYANTATITGNEPDPELGNNTSTVTPLPTTGVVNLAIQKTVTNASINIGDTFEYTVVVRNVGGTPATEVRATDVLPQGLTYISSSATSGTAAYTDATRTVGWNIGSLAVGATTTLTIKVRADRAGTVVNTATVVAKENETIITDNTSTVSSEVMDFRIPNVITPNGDGKNDTFRIDGLEAYPENTL